MPGRCCLSCDDLDEHAGCFIELFEVKQQARKLYVLRGARYCIDSLSEVRG